MDQQELRAIENRCIQEEPPECVAACPIHVDARTFIGHVSRGAWNDGWRILQKTMPFPGILGRICDAPCRLRCKRKEVGQAIEIGLLEQTCVQTDAPVMRLSVLRRKPKLVAVIGSDLDSLTVAWDLARKGWQVMIFEIGSRWGGRLRSIPETILPIHVIENEIGMLARLEVSMEKTAPGYVDLPASLIGSSADIVYVGLDSTEWIGPVSETISSHRIPVLSLIDVSRDGHTPHPIFGHIGQLSELCRSDPDNLSPVFRAAKGRWAATTIDRFLQQVSISAGREREGPFQTRLFTATTGIAPSSAVVPGSSDGRYSPEEAMAEAGRCLQCECLECVNKCSYLKHFGSYPKKYAREIYNNASIVMGARPANRMINSCSLCGLCEAVCPEGFAMQTICLEARRDMVKRGKMPPSAHEFALQDMKFSNSPHFAMARHEPGKESSSWVFFPGCQLCATSPELVPQVYAYLRQTLSGGVGLILGCCSAPAYWAGREELFQTEFSLFHKNWTLLGRPRLILACSSCFQMTAVHLPEAVTVSLPQLLETGGVPPNPDPLPPKHRLAIHDPCATRNQPEIRKSVRRLLKRMRVDIVELHTEERLVECCGFGGLMQNANPNLAKTVVNRLAEKSPADYVTYCAVCRDNVAATGKRVCHLLDLVFPDPERPDPLSRPRTGWSQRRENRSRLKDRLLREWWQERASPMKTSSRIRLIVPPEVEQVLENRRILKSDIEAVIAHVQAGGECLTHPHTGRFMATHQPFTVTFWVEYSMSQGEYLIHNAYCHRMEVTGKGRL